MCIRDRDRGLEGELAGDINFDIDDPDAPHWPLVIPFSQILVEFNPVETPSQLAEPFYDQIYRPFLNDLYRLIGGGSDAAARKDQSP